MMNSDSSGASLDERTLEPHRTAEPQWARNDLSLRISARAKTISLLSPGSRGLVLHDEQVAIPLPRHVDAVAARAAALRPDR
jgi:hypothetical protein